MKVINPIDLIAGPSGYPPPGPADPSVRPAGLPRRHSRGGRRRTTARRRQERALLFRTERESLAAADRYTEEARYYRAIGEHGMATDAADAAADARSDAAACRTARLGDRTGDLILHRPAVAVYGDGRPGDYNDDGTWVPWARTIVSQPIVPAGPRAPHGSRGEEIGTRTGTAERRSASLDVIRARERVITADCRRLSVAPDNAATVAMLSYGDVKRMVGEGTDR